MARHSTGPGLRVPRWPKPARRSTATGWSLTVALVMTLAGCTDSASSGRSPASTPAADRPAVESPTPSPSLDAQPVALPGRPVAAEYGLGAAWVSVDTPAATDPRVVKIDGRSKKITLTIKGPHRIDVGKGAIWGAGSPEFMGEATLRKIDPKTGKTLLAVPARYPFDVSVGPQAVWITTMQDGLGRVDPESGAITMVGTVGSYVLATKTAVWVSDTDSGDVLRIDPQTNKVVAKIRVGAPRDMVIARGNLWVGSDDGHIARIDTRSNRMTTIPGSGSVKAITACADAVWAPHRDVGVYRIEPATSEAELALPFENDLHLGIACGDGQLWMASQNDDAAYCHSLS